MLTLDLLKWSVSTGLGGSGSANVDEPMVPCDVRVGSEKALLREAIAERKIRVGLL